MVNVRNDSFAGDDIDGLVLPGGVFSRYYHGEKQVRSFAEIGVMLGRSKYDFDNPDIGGFDTTITSNITSFGGGVGIMAQLGPKVSFDSILLYNSVVDKSVDDNPQNERTITSGVQLRLGFSIYLN